MAISAQEGQKTHGTFKEHFSYLHEVLTRSVQEGAASPEEYQGTLLQILKAVEALRLKNEAALMELERQKAYHQAAVNVCSMMSSLVLNVVDARTRERLRILEGYKLLQQKELEEDRERLKGLQAAGKIKEAKELELSIARKEAELNASAVLSLGSEKEVEITKEAINSTQSILGGILGKHKPNPRTQEVSAIQEVVSESLKEVPVDEIKLITKKEKKKR
jgi:hypothetical protein